MSFSFLSVSGSDPDKISTLQSIKGVRGIDLPRGIGILWLGEQSEPENTENKLW